MTTLPENTGAPPPALERSGPQWLQVLVAGELGRLAAKGLRGMPAGEVTFEVPGRGTVARDAFELTISAWIRDIVVHYTMAGLEPSDEQRLRKGFQLLSSRAHYWPQPAALFPLVPERETEPPPELTEEEIRQRVLKGRPAHFKPENQKAAAVRDPEQYKANLRKVRRQLEGKG